VLEKDLPIKTTLSNFKGLSVKTGDPFFVFSPIDYGTKSQAVKSFGRCIFSCPIKAVISALRTVNYTQNNMWLLAVFCPNV
jgi:hypothetical protein